MMNYIKKSIKRKLIFFSALSLLITSLSIIAFSIVTTREIAQKSSEEKAASALQGYADRLRSEFEQNLKIAESYSSAMATLKNEKDKSVLERRDVIVQSKRIIEDNPSILGICVIFEPNQFDGKDAKYAGTYGHDSTGRFNCYWARDEYNKVVLEEHPDTNLNDPVGGDYYYWAKQTKQSRIVEPSLYPIAGKQVFMSAFSAPIINNNTFYGITGIDFSVAYLQDGIEKLKIEGGAAKMTLVSSGGLIIASQYGSKILGMEYAKVFKNDKSITNALEKMELYTAIVDDTLVMALPIKIGKTTTPWAVNIKAPMSHINKASNDLALELLALALIVGAIGMAMNTYYSKRISKPIVALTEFAEKVAKGEIDDRIALTNTDEIQALGSAFNQVVDTVSHLLKEVEDIHTEVREGNLGARGDIEKYPGKYGELLIKLNSIMDSIAGPLRESAEYFRKISEGNVPELIDAEHKGEFESINNSLNNCIRAINLLIKDSEKLFEAAIAGKLDYRANASAHNGDFKNIIDGVNATLDRLVGMFDELPLPIQIVDKQKNIVYINKKAKKLAKID
jgi:methyl-accepting chemotaxis protein